MKKITALVEFKNGALWIGKEQATQWESLCSLFDAMPKKLAVRMKSAFSQCHNIDDDICGKVGKAEYRIAFVEM